MSLGDPNGYYIWLPSTFLYDDVANPQKTLETRRRVFNQAPRSMAEEGFNRPEGSTQEIYLNKYTMGMAVLYSPFFVAAHTLAPIFGYEQDGFSLIYRYLIFLNAVVYGFLGLLVLRKVLLRYFSDKITAWTLGVIAFATNLWFFSVWNTGMSHAGSFFLFSLLLLFTEKWYDNQRVIYAIAVGAVYGLITLIRPTDAITVFVPVFWGVVSFASFRQRVGLLQKNWFQMGVAVICALVVGFPQLLYWKVQTGHFLYYSYGEEGFDFSNPHLLGGIFGYENGWLAYTPVMYLAILGIGWLWRRRNNYLLPVLLILPLQLYIIYSYWCWQWTNGFGARPMIQFYALLAFPLAGALAFAFSKKWLDWLAGGFVLLCAAINLSQTWQFNEGMVWSELGTRRFYFSSLGKTKLDANDLLYFDGAPQQPSDTAQLKLVKVLYFNDFEDSTGVQFARAERHSGQVGARVNRAQEFSPGMALEPVGPELKPNQWLKVSVWYLQKHEGIDFYKTSSLVTYLSRKGEKLDYYSIRLGNKPSPKGDLWSSHAGVWNQISYYVPVSKNIQADDRLQVYVWSPQDNDIFVDDLRVELYE